MKNIIIIFSVLLLTSTFVYSEEDNYSKSHRLGFKGGLYSPNLKADSLGIDLEAQFNAKIHNNVDSGPNFGLFYRRITDSQTNEQSDFIIVPLTFTFRFYPFSFGGKRANHGWFSPYALVNGGYYFSLLLNTNKLSDTNQIIPEGLGGFGASIGAGIELGTFGIVTIPDFAWFVEARYRVSRMISRRQYALDLNGYIVSFGARM